jgi:hypothetical protein
MLSRDEVWNMFQKIYFDSIDKGDMTKAVTIFHDDVEWIHTQVWEHDGYRRDKGSDRLKGRHEAEALLKGRKVDLRRQGVRHLLKDLVLEGNRGAFIGHVKGPGKELPLIAWFEIKDDKIYRYIVTPLYIPIFSDTR